MRALTVWQPWAACIAHGPKLVENRKLPPPSTVTVPFEMAVHAAKLVRKRSEELLDVCIVYGRWTGIAGLNLVRGEVIAVASVIGHYSYVGPRPQPHHPDWEERMWESGPVCWQLDNVRALAEPVPCRGKQGLWFLPPDVETKVLEQLR